MTMMSRISTFTFAGGDGEIGFAADGVAWRCTLADYVCTKAAAAAGQAGFGRGTAGPQGSSPDGRWMAFIRDGNIYGRPADNASDPGVALTTTGTLSAPFTLNANAVAWSPDPKKIAATRTVTPGDRRMVRYVESSPADQVQPRTFERQYTKPGDLLDKQERVVNALTKANQYFDLLVMPGEEHGGGRRGASAPYGDKKLWVFFVRHVIGSPTPDWNTVAVPPTRTGIDAGLFGPSWDDVQASWERR
jgi:hypothetical protein